MVSDEQRGKRDPKQRKSSERQGAEGPGAEAREPEGLAPQVEPVVKADVREDAVPAGIAGALPENAGQDRGDVNRTPAASGEDRTDELVDLLNRLIMFEREAVGILQNLVRAERADDVRERIWNVLEEDKHAIDVAERAIRDLGGRPSVARKTAGAVAAVSRFLVESVPDRAREVVRQRDLNAARERTPFGRLIDYTDAYLAETTTHAHWRLLRRIADESNERALLDAVNEAEPAAAAHVEYFEGRAIGAARERFVTGTIR